MMKVVLERNCIDIVMAVTGIHFFCIDWRFTCIQSRRTRYNGFSITQCRVSDGKGLRTRHCLSPGLHSFQRRFASSPPLNKLLPFFAIFVDGIGDGYFAPFVFEHAL
jgi:hypothetical protein